MDKIKLYSRYKDVDTYFIPANDNCGIFISNGEYTRRILSNDSKSIKAIDFEGGPMLFIDSIIPGTNKKIKSIKAGYYVELE